LAAVKGFWGGWGQLAKKEKRKISLICFIFKPRDLGVEFIFQICVKNKILLLFFPFKKLSLVCLFPFIIFIFIF
jgi:hypothetical protein